MNVNEYGVVFRFSVAFDVATFTALALTFTKPDGTALTVNDPDVTVGTVDVVTEELGTFLAFKHVLYTFQNGDVDQAGAWTARLAYDEGSAKHLISDIGAFTIDP